MSPEYQLADEHQEFYLPEDNQLNHTFWFNVQGKPPLKVQFTPEGVIIEMWDNQLNEYFGSIQYWWEDVTEENEGCISTPSSESSPA